MLLTEEKIKQAIKDAHKRRPGVILSAMEVYEAITQAQHEEDIKGGAMEIEYKLKILKSLDTKDLIKKLREYEDALEKAMREDASFKDLNRGYLASGASDCQEVKRITAELNAQIPETDKDGKKLTVAQKEAWLICQRSENHELSAAIAKQKDIAFLLENNQVAIDMARRRLESTRAVLALKTQQIAFLAGS